MSEPDRDVRLRANQRCPVLLALFPPLVARGGGQGEKKTLRMVAQYADESNLTGEVRDIPRKLDVLAEHGDRLGRDRSEIVVTKLLIVAVAPTREELESASKALG